GSLWVGTTHGLSCFHGTNVTSLAVGQGLPSEIIASVHVSGTNSVWITTRKGMCQFMDGRLSPLEFQGDSAGESTEMIGLYNDQSGNLWAFGDTYLVNLNDGKRFNYFRSGDTSSLRIWCSCQGRDGQLWIGTSGQGVFSFAEGRFRPLSLREASLGSDVQAIHEDAAGNLWLGTFSSGLVRLQARRMQTLDAVSGLPSEMASCLAATPDGRVWAGYADEGLFVRQGEHFERCKRQHDGEPFNLITSVAATVKGEVWAGTLGFGLIHLQDGETARWTTENGLSDDEITAVAAQSDGSIWVGTTAGTVHHLSGNQMITYGPQAGLANAPVTCILAVGLGKVIVGNENGGLTELAGNEFVPLDSTGVLSGVPVRALYEDGAGRLWIGTQGKGLGCEDSGRVTVWDVKTGFLDNEVNGILADDLGRLWINTRSGVLVSSADSNNPANGTTPEFETVKAYEPSSLGVVSRGWPEAVKTSDGHLWFAGPEAVYALDPHDFHGATPLYPVELETILVNGQPLPFRTGSGPADAPDTTKLLRLPSNLRTLDFEFTTPSLDAPERVQFQHRLDHFDKDWVDGANERRVRYNGLPFGQYEFHVRARNAEGTWGRDASVGFDLPLPFWRQAWVILTESLLAVFLVVAGARVFFHRRLRLKLARISQQEAMERERMRIARDMHDEIGSRLTRISYFSELALQDETPSRLSLESIAGTIRDLLKTLDEIVWAVNPHNDTLENLAEYLGHYVTEYLQNTTVGCTLNIPPNLPPRVLSAETRHNVFLAFEEAVGNALRHSGAAMIGVEMNLNGEQFVIRIQDNGRGFDPAANNQAVNGRNPSGPLVRSRKGNGLVNMRERLAGVGGETLIESQPGQGTKVTFSVPVNNEPKDVR
ncbi:MAG TPA: two-component regulator propeller domain-containing protein, partial [Candidatus Angelobacter sp.]|nr:two-component regulator propeller domain-containing protein [Candidatus Angelobacter sp.]